MSTATDVRVSELTADELTELIRSRINARYDGFKVEIMPATVAELVEALGGVS